MKASHIAACLILVLYRINAHKDVRELFCGDGYAHDKLFGDGYRFTCKPGPGKFSTCKNYWFSLKEPMNCPAYGYISGWRNFVGKKVMVRCCFDKGFTYRLHNCITRHNDRTANGELYRVYKGKYITGFSTFNNGITFYNTECRFDAPNYSYSKQQLNRY